MKNKTNKALSKIIRETINRWEMWDAKLNTSGLNLIALSIGSLSIPDINIGSLAISSPPVRLLFLIFSFYVSFVVHENFSERMRLNSSIIQDNHLDRVTEFLERKKKIGRNCQAYNAGCLFFGIIFFYTLYLAYA